MTWPTSDVSTADNDNTGDSPAAWRAASLDLAQKFNEMRNHVSVFIRGLLDDADAAAARTTLGAAASGTNTDITSLSAPALGAATATTAAVDTNTTQVATTAYVVAQAASASPVADGASAVVGTSKRFARADHVHPEGSIGAGQTWTDVNGSRSFGVTYTNSTGRPIVVAVRGASSATGSDALIYNNGTANIVYSTSTPATAGLVLSLVFVVPAGTTYNISTVNGFATKAAWWELR